MDQLKLHGAVSLLLAMSMGLIGCASDGDPVRPPIRSDPDRAVVKVIVPHANGFQVSQGAGVWLDDGRVLTACHILFDDSGNAHDVQSLRVEALSGPLQGEILGSGGRVQWSWDQDVAVIAPAYFASDPGSGAQPAAFLPSSGDRVTAYLLSSQRGDRTVARLWGTFLSSSSDGRFFAISGMSMRGDSGGPIFNSDGELIGLIVSGSEGPEQLGVPFELRRTSSGFQTRWSATDFIYYGDYVLCASLAGW